MRSKNNFFLLVIVLLFISQDLFSQNSFFQKSPYKYTYGDSLSWKDPNYNDSAWQILFNDYLETENEFCWIRTNIFLTADVSNYKDLALLLDISADYEVYWNGVKLGQNFKGNFNEITSKGNYSESYSLNNSLVFLDKNVLAIRAKFDDESPLNFAYLSIADPLQIKKTEYQVFGYLIFLMIVYLVLLFILIKFFKTYSSFLVTAFLSLIAFLMVVSLFIEYLFFSGFASYSYSYLGENLINILVYLTLFSFSVFFVEFNKVKNGKLYLLLICSILSVSYFLELGKYYYLTFGFLPPFLIVFFYYEKKSFIKIYSIAFLIVILIFLNSGMNISLINLPFIILLFYISLIYLRNEDQQKLELSLAKLRTTRLETEMLKKIIQPHYIMNSLNAVLEWIEESPKQGLRFIQNLSNEFRLFLTYSDKKFISVKDELEMCNNHLKIMEFRQHRKFTLKHNIQNITMDIPPAIFHTLIENGITHNSTNSNSICFFIDEKNEPNSTIFRISVDYLGEFCEISDEQEREVFDNLKIRNEIIDGNGIKYIKSRLTESYGKNWNLSYSGNDKLWITIIEIYS